MSDRAASLAGACADRHREYRSTARKVLSCAMVLVIITNDVWLNIVVILISSSLVLCIRS